MSKKEKLLEEIKNNPKDVRFEVLSNILIGLGFTERQSRKGTSHYVYTKDDIILTIPKRLRLTKSMSKKRWMPLKSSWSKRRNDPWKRLWIIIST